MAKSIAYRQETKICFSAFKNGDRDRDACVSRVDFDVNTINPGMVNRPLQRPASHLYTNLEKRCISTTESDTEDKAR